MHEYHGGPSYDRNEPETGIPKERSLSTRESKFVGLSIAIKKTLNYSILNWRNNRTSNPDGDDIQERYPLLLLFPDLRKNSADMLAIIEGNLVPEEITRKLVGKKADFTHLKKSRQRQVERKNNENIQTEVARHAEPGSIMTKTSLMKITYRQFWKNRYFS
ncbi:uncharacterized protein LOC123311503 isoform X1 [Coccinella septempunctata]|uniref:uncharacterized protein LOC123311503 isoform X1 n=1 Tax=Coccinella septempunctata TaxID=41139 RepID=UPI001D07A56D|nr:uncharacterized protein LOC123311503 isoform X1 [Coccinella septempunctata]